ncbi:MAG: hypothetical protein CMK99_13390 [Pseudomonas sp.]|nr:hypothetical protein [Pseudomonas sp.]HBS81060.1 hypothetical protein [Pseudomonas sp.]|tara:strand:+ start:16524 stop:16709 length:186 start_codon:yes stop_codon:yes gene_type:complete
MGESLRRVVVIGASLGLTSKIAAMFPDAKPARMKTQADLDRIAAAEAKRARRAEKHTRPTP